jgi:replicative DNA helicase
LAGDFAPRPSNGKTVFALNWLDNHARAVERTFAQDAEAAMAMPRRALVFLTERTADVARMSWAAMRLGYEVDDVLCERWDQLPVRAEVQLAKELAWIATIERQGWVEFVDEARPTVSVMGNTVADAEPHIVLFDYIQKVKAEPRQTRFDAVSEAAEMFQTMAVRLGLLVIVTSQLKRRGDGVFDKYRPPHLEDFKLSGEIEEVADVALGLYRPLARMMAKEERDIRQGLQDLERFKIHDTTAIKVLKHRYRPSAADRIIFVEHKHGQLRDKQRDVPQPSSNAGDAWEPDEDRLPF